MNKGNDRNRSQSSRLHCSAHYKRAVESLQGRHAEQSTSLDARRLHRKAFSADVSENALRSCALVVCSAFSAWQWACNRSE